MPVINIILKSREKTPRTLPAGIASGTPKVSGDSADVKFLLTVRNVVISRLSDPNLVIRHLAAEAGLSRTNLFLKLKALTGLTPQEFIKTIRLEQAAQLLHKTNLTVAEIAYRVGFKYPKYFSTCFLRQFQQSPSDYRKTKPA
jgi:AraC-like DNA-binding protein